MLNITKYTPVNKGFIVGVFNCEMKTEYGEVYFNKCTLFQKDGRRWVSLYSESYEKEGKKSYFPINGFKNKKAYEKFQIDAKKGLDECFEKLGNRLINTMSDIKFY
jgi:hypothetical protein